MRISTAILLAAGLWFESGAHAAMKVDASKPPAAPAPLAFEAAGRSPQGHVVALNSRYLTLDGKPWFPVMGEFQYSRYPEADWEREILKMKAGGIQIVSTYIFWIHHEEIEGHFDWSGRRDLRRFVELASKHGLYVWARLGPWDHGEVRNGGLPDWVVRGTKTRQNDPEYLKYVERLYGEIGRQLKGLYWKDGGPVMGVQIENEYHERGAGKGEEHILTLKQMALAAGIQVPFYSITGWDEAAVPDRGLIPVFGGYPDGFWYRSLSPLPPSPNYFFTPIRCEENVGPDLAPLRRDIDAKFAAYPYLTAEMGGGMELSYHRRPSMSADDIAAAEVVKLGSGVALYGYYMFHGGTNPEGKQTTLQESQATGYINDLPVKTYDFQAPLGEFGQMRPSFHTLRLFHLFLQDFGAALAPMASYFPERMPAGRQDADTPRIAVRADGHSGFLFINNYQKDHPLPARTEFQARIQLAGGEAAVPRQPLTIPSGAYTFWPVEMPVGGTVLEYATAQPVAKIEDPDTVVFATWPGIAAEFVFHEPADVTVAAPGAAVKRENGRIAVTGAVSMIELRAKSGRVTRILVLSRERARTLWQARLAGRERLIFSSAELYFDGDRIHLESTDPAALSFAVFPHLEAKLAGFARSADDGVFECYRAHVDAVSAVATVRQLAKAGVAPPAKIGSEVAMAPEESAYKAAARWRVQAPEVKSENLSELFLQIAYRGDVGRLYAAGRLVTDDFYHGAVWEVGLRNLAPEELKQGLELQILPLRQDAPIYLPEGAKPALPAGGEIAQLIEVKVAPKYHVSADVAAH